MISKVYRVARSSRFILSATQACSWAATGTENALRSDAGETDLFVDYKTEEISAADASSEVIRRPMEKQFPPLYG